jgi:L-iditol 2-dehydrogenase
VHYYTHGRNGDFAVRAPLVLGHEAAGIVVAVGPPAPTAPSLSSAPSPSNKANQQSPPIRVGQRVAIEAGIACRTCAYCEGGRYNLCKGMRFASSAARFPHLDGTLQGRMNHPTFVLHPLPDNVSFALAALAEPLSVLIHAGRRIALGSSPYPESVLVFGVGAMGLLACALAKHRGARRVCAVDINRERLEFAKREGFADEIYCLPAPGTKKEEVTEKSDACCAQPPPAPTQTPQTPAHLDISGATAMSAQILAALALPPLSTSASTSSQLPYPLRLSPSYTAPGGPDSAGFDVVFECTGAPSAIQASILCAAAGGRAMLVGMGTRAAVMLVAGFALREVDVKGSFRYAGTYGEAVRLLGGEDVVGEDTAENRARAKALPMLVEKLVTHRFPLDQADRAFEMLAKGVDEHGRMVLKVLVGENEV